MMNMTRRKFIGGVASAASFTALATAPGCALLAPGKKGQLAIQSWGIGYYIMKHGLEKSLAEVAAIGYKGIEFADHHGKKPNEIKKILDDNGLKACGVHLWNGLMGFADINKCALDVGGLKRRCEMELSYGNNLLICPGKGNFPPGVSYGTGAKEPFVPNQKVDDFMKNLVEMYNKAAEVAKTMGCKVGIHNHQWEFRTKMMDGSTLFDYFFTNTTPDVCMELDTGCAFDAGADICKVLKKYPHRSVSIHAKEYGTSPKFDGTLGKNDEPDCALVPWDDIFPVADRDGIEWWVVECERQKHSLQPITDSYKYLKGKGRVDA